MSSENSKGYLPPCPAHMGAGAVCASEQEPETSDHENLTWDH